MFSNDVIIVTTEFKNKLFGEECFSFNQNEEHRLGALLTWAIPYKIPINKVNIC